MFSLWKFNIYFLLILKRTKSLKYNWLLYQFLKIAISNGRKLNKNWIFSSQDFQSLLPTHSPTISPLVFFWKRIRRKLKHACGEIIHIERFMALANDELKNFRNCNFLIPLCWNIISHWEAPNMIEIMLNLKMEWDKFKMLIDHWGCQKKAPEKFGASYPDSPVSLSSSPWRNLMLIFLILKSFLIFLALVALSMGNLGFFCVSSSWFLILLK